MPNIIGSFTARQMNSMATGNLPSIQADGKLYIRDIDNGSNYLMLQYANTSPNEIAGYKIQFNANRFNSIYGNSTTVQCSAIINILQLKI